MTETTLARFLRLIPGDPERAARMAAAHDARIAREGPDTPDPECQHCGQPVRDGYRQPTMNGTNDMFWVHIGGYRWCNPQEPGQTTHAEPHHIPIKYVIGDAAQPVGDSPKVIVHVVNDIGRWGAGFTHSLNKHWPLARANYEAWAIRAMEHPDTCPPFDLGHVRVPHVGDGVYVANIIAQRGVRSRSNPHPLNYSALAVCLGKVAGWAMRHEATVHMPRIGCGLAGGSWDHVKPMISDILCVRRVPVTVYDLQASREPRGTTAASSSARTATRT